MADHKPLTAKPFLFTLLGIDYKFRYNKLPLLLRDTV